VTTDDDSCVRTAAATLQGTLGLGGLGAELVVAFERMKVERDNAIKALGAVREMTDERSAAATVRLVERGLITADQASGAARAAERIREATQALIEVVGAAGPMDLENAVARVVNVLETRESHAEALVAVVHDALWSDQHRGEDVGDMARRVQADLAAIADENIELEDRLREALASTGRARYENILDRAEKAERERDAARAALVMAENPKLLGDRLSMLCCIPPKYRIAPSCEEASAYSIAIGASLAAMQSAITDAERERDEATKRHHEALDRLDHQTEVLDNAHPGNRLSVSGLLREAAFERQQAVLADERMHAAFVARSRAESERDKALASLADVIAADEALLLECMTQAWGVGVGVGRHETSTGSYSGPPDKNEFRVIIRRVMAWITSKKKKDGRD
jgi:hypothetical protein